MEDTCAFSADVLPLIGRYTYDRYRYGGRTGNPPHERLKPSVGFLSQDRMELLPTAMAYSKSSESLLSVYLAWRVNTLRTGVETVQSWILWTTLGCSEFRPYRSVHM